jgi:Trk K+ transport system NAD-binding subunit
VTTQACRQPGLASVFTDLLDFANDEFYFATAEAVVGRSYAEVLLAFETSSLVGTLSPDGAVRLNPPADTVIQPDDRLILVAADDSAISFTGFKAM